MHCSTSLPLIIDCDASQYGISAVLSHKYPDKSERPIAYTSRTLTPAEKNYSQIEKESLAIIDAVKKFHQFIYGCSFTIVTDHKPLLGILAENKPIPVMAASRILEFKIVMLIV